MVLTYRSALDGPSPAFSALSMQMSVLLISKSLRASRNSSPTKSVLLATGSTGEASKQALLIGYSKARGSETWDQVPRFLKILLSASSTAPQRLFADHSEHKFFPQAVLQKHAVLHDLRTRALYDGSGKRIIESDIFSLRVPNDMDR